MSGLLSQAAERLVMRGAKMVSPQNLAIGASAVGLAGREGDIFRKVLGWSVVLVLLMAVLVLLQSGPLSWMVP